MGHVRRWVLQWRVILLLIEKKRDYTLNSHFSRVSVSRIFNPRPLGGTALFVDPYGRVRSPQNRDEISYINHVDIKSLIAFPTLPFHYQITIFYCRLPIKLSFCSSLSLTVKSMVVNWMTLIIHYLRDGVLSKDKSKARLLRLKAARYILYDGKL